MLAQNFKTADELGLSPEIVECLVTVLGMLERGEITSEQFDMDEWWRQQHDARGRFTCGTVGCIGGWTEAIGRLKGYDISLDGDNWLFCPPDLVDLFYPQYRSRSSWDAWDATPEQAAMALRTYLTTGEDGWRAVRVRRRAVFGPLELADLFYPVRRCR